MGRTVRDKLAQTILLLVILALLAYNAIETTICMLWKPVEAPIIYCTAKKPSDNDCTNAVQLQRTSRSSMRSATPGAGATTPDGFKALRMKRMLLGRS